MDYSRRLWLSVQSCLTYQAGSCFAAGTAHHAVKIIIMIDDSIETKSSLLKFV